MLESKTEVSKQFKDVHSFSSEGGLTLNGFETALN